MIKAMKENAKQKAIEFNWWTREKGYEKRPQGKFGEWKWRRQVNQILYSEWITDDELYSEFLETAGGQAGN